MHAATAGVRAAYVHLPFCAQHCHYCDFAIEVLRLHQTPRAAQRMAKYVDCVRREIVHTRSPTRCGLDSVYFGGGTPSLMPVELVASILDDLAAKFGINTGAEISFEVDPGTFDLPYLLDLAACGVTRLSLGVQAFQDHLLQACGRGHTSAHVSSAIDTVGRSGIRQWSMDLICGLPGQSIADWEASLAKTVAAEPSHVSVYGLQVEERTRFGVLHRKNQLQLPETDVAADMYSMASELLQQQGYEHYEVSSYAAKPSARSRHNQVYWTGVPFYGFGMGAVSFVGGQRLGRPRSIRDYTQLVDQMTRPQALTHEHPTTPRCDVVWVTANDRLRERVMLQLRTSNGLDLLALAKDHGAHVAQSIERAALPLVDEGLARVRSTQETRSLHLTDPKGFLVCDAVTRLLWEATDPAGQQQQH